MNVAATTDDTEEQTDTPASPPDRPRGTGPVAMAVSVFGELLITAGLILGLFVVYSLWWTNVVADRTADKQGDKVRDKWAQGTDTGPGALDTKDGIGFLHVPAMKNGEVQIDYRLYKSPQGWRVYDMNVLGAWLIQTYRTQFSDKIQQSGVDGLIRFLTDRNKQLASGKQ